MKKFILFLLVCVVLTIAIFLFFFGYSDCVTIQSYDTGKVLFKHEIKPEMVVIFSYIHSVSLTPIEEYLDVNARGYVLRKVTYIDQGGAGMPEFAFGDQQFTIEDNTFVIKGFDRFFESITINVQKEYKDEIAVDNHILDLSMLLGKNGRIVLDVEKRFFKR